MAKENYSHAFQNTNIIISDVGFQYFRDFKLLKNKKTRGAYH